MRFFIYSRKSVYTGKGESIENQIEMCKQHIYSKMNTLSPDGSQNAEIIVYEDEGFTGKDTRRPQFQRMMQDIKLNKPDYIVCYRLDRISRNVRDFSNMIEYFSGCDISFICVREDFDTTKPMGKAMMYIASVFSQLERDILAERVRDNMMMLARTGRWLGGSTPTGFTSEKAQEVVVDGKIRTSFKLKANPDEIAAVQVMFEKFLELRAVSGVSKHLIRNEIKSRSGEYFSLLGIKEILQNPVYCVADQDALNYFTDMNAEVCFQEKDCSDKYGILSYNKRDYKKKNAPRQSIDKWIIAVGKHKGIVSGKQWITVQDILEDNKPDGKKPAKMHNDYSLLSGLIFCEKCGKRLFAKRGLTGKRKDESDRFYYMCNSKMRGGFDLCDIPNVNGKDADQMVCDYLMEYTEQNSSIFKLLEKLKQEFAEQEREAPGVSIEARLKKCADEIENLVSTLSAGNLNAALIQHINSRVNELDAEQKRLLAERERIREEESKLANREIQIDMIAGALGSLKNDFDLMSIHEKRTLIRLLIKKITWDGQDLHIFPGSE